VPYIYNYVLYLSDTLGTDCSNQLSRTVLQYSHTTHHRSTVCASYCNLITNAPAPRRHVLVNNTRSALLPSVPFPSLRDSWLRGMKHNIITYFNSSLQCSQSVPSACESHCPASRGQRSFTRINPRQNARICERELPNEMVGVSFNIQLFVVYLTTISLAQIIW
jgi:hypothetical protein